MSENIAKENKMGVMPVNKLLITMSLPMMFSMLVQAVYNIVDSIFVSRIPDAGTSMNALTAIASMFSSNNTQAGNDALTAVSLAFPIFSLMISFGAGTSVGINAVLSMRLGQKNQAAVNATAVNGLLLALFNYVVFAIAGIFAINPYILSQVDDPQVIQFACQYIQIILFAGFGMFMGITFDRLLQSTGRTFYTMITQLIGALTNIILDPILIFGIGPIPAMGIAGAAYATVAGQILSMIVSVIFNLTINKDIQFKFKGFRPDGSIISQIYKVGLPSIILQAVGSFTTYGMNLILTTFESVKNTAISVYGAYFKLNSFIFMPVFGLNNGIVPILAYNYGAKNKKRITATIKCGLMYAMIIMCVGCAIFELFPEKLLGLFNADEKMLQIGVPCLRLIAPSFIGAAFAITIGCVFQALGKAVYSMVVSLARQICVLLPVAYFFSLTGNINNVWLCFIVAEFISVALSAFYYARIYRKKIKPLSQPE